MTEKYFTELENMAINIISKASKGQNISMNEIVLLKMYQDAAEQMTSEPFLDKLLKEIKKVTGFIKDNFNLADFEDEDENNNIEEINDDEL